MSELGALLIYRTWAVLLIALNVPALVFRARRKDGALLAEFGERWQQYAEQVPAWLPGKRGQAERPV